MGGMGDSGGDTYNVVSGSRVRYLVQAREIHGDIHFHAAPATPLETATQALAHAIHAQWREELNVWDVADPSPLDVSWVADWASADHRSNVGGQVAGRADDLTDLLGAFRALRTRRLAVLGAAGSGKTTLAGLLALEMLARPEEGEPVPVPLPLSSWDPDRDHLHDWIARRIAQDHPGLPHVDGRHPAARMVRDRLVLPVLDGLDEVPQERRARMLTGINRALAAGDPVVLTCRTAEYESLVADGPCSAPRRSSAPNPSARTRRSPTSGPRPRRGGRSGGSRWRRTCARIRTARSRTPCRPR